MARSALKFLALVAIALSASSSSATAQEPTAANVAPAPPFGGLTTVVAGTDDVQVLVDAQVFQVESVWRLDVQSQRWDNYVPGAPAVANSLQALEPTDLVTLKSAPHATLNLGLDVPLRSLSLGLSAAGELIALLSPFFYRWPDSIPPSSYLRNVEYTGVLPTGKAGPHDPGQPYIVLTEASAGRISDPQYVHVQDETFLFYHRWLRGISIRQQSNGEWIEISSIPTRYVRALTVQPVTTDRIGLAWSQSLVGVTGGREIHYTSGDGRSWRQAELLDSGVGGEVALISDEAVGSAVAYVTCPSTTSFETSADCALVTRSIGEDGRAGVEEVALDIPNAPYPFPAPYGAFDGNGHLVLLWPECPASGSCTVIEVHRSDDGSWSARTPVATDTFHACCAGWMSGLDVGPNNTLSFLYSRDEEDGVSLWITQKTASGEWRSPRFVGQAPHTAFRNSVVAGGGQFHIGWLDNATPTAVMGVSTDVDGPENESWEVGSAPGAATNPMLLAGPDGTAWVVWDEGGTLSSAHMRGSTILDRRELPGDWFLFPADWSAMALDANASPWVATPIRVGGSMRLLLHHVTDDGSWVSEEVPGLDSIFGVQPWIRWQDDVLELIVLDGGANEGRGDAEYWLTRSSDGSWSEIQPYTPTLARGQPPESWERDGTWTSVAAGMTDRDIRIVDVHGAMHVTWIEMLDSGRDEIRYRVVPTDQ